MFSLHPLLFILFVRLNRIAMAIAVKAVVSFASPGEFLFFFAFIFLRLGHHLALRTNLTSK